MPDSRIRTTTLVVAILSCGFVHSSVQTGDVLIYKSDFERQNRNQPPPGFVSFTPGTKPNVVIDATRSLRGKRSGHGGLVALSHWFDSPQSRIMIEFSFAVSPGAGRVFHVWTQEPGGKDASQFNLCVQAGSLQHFDGRSRTWEMIDSPIVATKDATKPVWHRLRAIIDSRSRGIDIWLSEPGSDRLPDSPTTVAAYRTGSVSAELGKSTPRGMDVGGFSFVSGTRIAPSAWYKVNKLVVRAGTDLSAPGPAPAVPEPYELWSGRPIPQEPSHIPFADNIEHRTIHRPDKPDYKFLHGAAILEHRGVFYANWANSPINENGPHETMQGRRSTDGGLTWSQLEVIGPGFKSDERHSHGVLFVHDDRVWAIASRFGGTEPGKKFPGLKAEAFVLNLGSNRWDSKGIVMKNCWPYDKPVRMKDGNFITGGQDKDGLPVVAISNGDNFLQWDSVLVPYHPRLAPSYAETTVWAEDTKVTAIIRGGAGVAWVATSMDYGRTWTPARASNLPMPRSKAYLGKLSTDQLFLVSNLKNRDTLVISVSRPGEHTLSRMLRIRSGKSVAPRFKGASKFKQWSYPYAYEHDNKLYIVYSVGKEECGLSVIPIESLRHL